jgi:hypothetical protein
MPEELSPRPEPGSAPDPLVELKAKAVRFRWTLFAFVLLCFVLPFVQVSCQQQKLMSFTGFQMAFGTEIQEPQMFGPAKTRQISGDWLLLLSFLAALTGLVCSLLKIKSVSLVTAVCGAAGFILLLVFKVRLDNEVLKQGGGLLDIDYQFGFIAASLLFLASAALNGYVYYGERAEAVAAGNAPANPSEQFDRLKTSAAGLAQQTEQWVAGKDVPGWVRGHAVLLGAVAGGVVLLLVVYYAFIKPSPSADGKEAALAYVNCQTAYKAGADSTHQSFLEGFSGQNYLSRADAEQKLEALRAGGRQVYGTCQDAADALYKKLAARYADDSGGLATFSEAFTGNNGGSKSAGEIEQESSSFVAVNDKIQSIRAPLPGPERIAKDLLGKRMEGWNFSYASEFKNVKVVSTRPDGDVSVLRTYLDLEDQVTKELYLAVLDLKYSLNLNGEWDYDGFTQLLYNKSDVSYFDGDNIFLVGKWRWQDNYATYNPDGTWFGDWDNGNKATGVWRIVKGNLRLTNNGRDWVNTKIMQFSGKELVVGEETPVRAERVE